MNERLTVGRLPIKREWDILAACLEAVSRAGDFDPLIDGYKRRAPFVAKHSLRCN